MCWGLGNDHGGSGGLEICTSWVQIFTPCKFPPKSENFHTLQNRHGRTCWATYIVLLLGLGGGRGEAAGAWPPREPRDTQDSTSLLTRTKTQPRWDTRQATAASLRYSYALLPKSIIARGSACPCMPRASRQVYKCKSIKLSPLVRHAPHQTARQPRRPSRDYKPPQHPAAGPHAAGPPRVHHRRVVRPRWS